MKEVFHKSRFLNILLLIPLSIGSFTLCSAQDVILKSQAEVNSFEGASVISNLIISGADIVDLSPLMTITTIEGSLSIFDNASLTSLEGLNNLDSVGGKLSIKNNTVLKNLVPILSMKDNTPLNNRCILESLININIVNNSSVKIWVL